MPKKSPSVRIQANTRSYAQKSLNSKLKKIGISRRNVRGMAGSQTKRRGRA